MKVWRVVDNGVPGRFTADLALMGKLFIEMSKKYPENNWFWIEEEDL